MTLSPTPTVPETAGDLRDAPVPILYTNWRGETAVRRIVPRWQDGKILHAMGTPPLWFGSTEWHPEPQWLLTAEDVDKGAPRDFALSGIKAWGGEAIEAALATPTTPHPTGDVAALRALSERATPGSASFAVEPFNIADTGDADLPGILRVSAVEVGYVHEKYGPGVTPRYEADGAFFAACWNYVRTQLAGADTTAAPGSDGGGENELREACKPIRDGVEQIEEICRHSDSDVPGSEPVIIRGSGRSQTQVCSYGDLKKVAALARQSASASGGELREATENLIKAAWSIQSRMNSEAAKSAADQILLTPEFGITTGDVRLLLKAIQKASQVALATPAVQPAPGVERVRQAAEELLNACVSDMGYGDETGDYPDRDDEPVGASVQGPLAVQFGHMRRLRDALAASAPPPPGGAGQAQIPAAQPTTSGAAGLDREAVARTVWFCLYPNWFSDFNAVQWHATQRPSDRVDTELKKVYGIADRVLALALTADRPQAASEEGLARALSKADWPLATPAEQEQWADAHWREKLPAAKAVLAAITPAGRGADADGWRPERVRHVKRGTEYEVLYRGAELQVSLFDTEGGGPVLREGERLVIYRGADGKLWAREETEFDDGRFVPAAPTAQGEA